MPRVFRLAIIVLLFTLFSFNQQPARAIFDPGDCADYQYGVNQPSQDCLDTMLEFPEPLVSEIALDTSTLALYSYWRVGPGATPLYDTPNGNVIGQIDAGFNFVNAVDTSVEGWIQTQDGYWVSRTNAAYVEPSQLTGVVLMNGLEYPFAWVLGDQMTSPAPGAQQSMEGRFLPRYSRVNLFSEYQTEDGWNWYMVGPDQWVEQRNISIIKPVERPEGVEGRWVAVDLYEQNLVAYEGDTAVFATLVATGLPGTDTNEGVFTIWASLDHDAMTGFAGAPNAYALQSVPYVMYFDDSISLHGTYWHDLFGFRRSRGCVNLSISDARFLFEWIQQGTPNEDGNIITYVYVHASGDYQGDGPQTK
jgi:hypothetical protein